MLTISPTQFDALRAERADKFVERVLDFLESDFPESAGPDRAAGQRVALELVDKATSFGLHSQEGVLRFVGMFQGYFVHEPQAFAWALDLLSDPDLPEQQKLLALEHRLYGVPLWA